MTTVLPGNILYAGETNFIETVKPRSLAHFILEQIKRHNNRILLIDASKGREYTAKEIYDSSVCLANALRNLGIKRGDVIAISSENRFEYALAIYASLAINATVTLLNVTYSESEINHAFGLSKPRFVFASKQSAEKITKISQSNKFIEQIILFDATDKSSKALFFKDLMENSKIRSQIQGLPKTAENTLDDVALIIYSSGTTGLPKGVQLKHRSFFSGAEPDILAAVNDITKFTIAPWCHIMGFTVMIAAAIEGSKMVFLPQFKADDFLRAIEKYQVYMAMIVPPLMTFLAKHPDVDKYNLTSLKIIFCGAAPLSKDTEDLVKKRIGVEWIRQGYGLSESSRGIIMQNDRYCKPGSIGGLMKNIFAKVIDPDTGEALGPNKPGELCFKGDQLMKGYIGDANATQTIIRDGWLHTGDIGYYDEDFEFFVVDRIKELIKYKGFQVAPAEIESLLLTNPKVNDAAVIGKPDEEAGELPMAFVVKQDGVDLTEEEVMKFVADRVSPAKRLRGGVLFVDEIPKNPSGKILRRVLRDMIKTKQRSKL